MKLIPLFLLFCAPLSASEGAANVVISTVSPSVSEIYNPVNGKDPMIVSTVYSGGSHGGKLYSAQSKVPVVSSTFSISNLAVVGIVDYSSRKEALLKDQGNGKIYILKGGLLYDGDKKEVKGIRGAISGKQVILKSSDPHGGSASMFIK